MAGAADMARSVGIHADPQRLRRELAQRLADRIEGEVRFDGGSRALYATDASIYRQVPIGVVLPKSAEDVVAIAQTCREFEVPLLPRGGGTSLAGQCCNVAVVMDFTKYMGRVLDIDRERRLARVQPGCVLDVLREAAEQHGLTFGPDPSTHSHNTLGGMIGNNSCGVHSVMSGRTADNVQSLEILTYDGLRLRVGPTPEDELDAIIRAGGRRGELYAGLKALRDEHAQRVRERYPDIPRRVSGYNLDALLPENGFNVARALVGSEGTCVTILEAEVNLVESPQHRCLLVIGCEDVYAAGDIVPDVLAHRPIGLEGLDDVLVDGMRKKHMHPDEARMLPSGRGWLFAEFGGASPEQACASARGCADALARSACPPDVKLMDDPAQAARLWAVRESGLGATAHVPGERETHPGWEDAAVRPEHVGDYLREFRALMDRYGYKAALYGHFGDGCIHCRINYDLGSEDGLARWRAFIGDAADLVLRYGGSLSGEHGDGQARADLLPKMYGPELVAAFQRFKQLWDPADRMNPGKVVSAYSPTSNLRDGPDFHPPLYADAQFDYADDHHRFAVAANRCVGIGKCRNHSGGVMCPSYRATGEEKYSTRGRARLLFEMMKGGPIEDGFASDAVHDALDLCLACKGCKRDCPVEVDMATYKAEFMAHHYQGRLRPRAAYSMGLIWWWSRIASHMPRLVNLLFQTPGLSRLIKKLGGIAPQRRMPRYAHQTFRRWFAAREQPDEATAERPPVLLWPDTWNNHFQTEPLQAAVQVLEDAGYRVLLPDRPLCCGRPLYAEGMLSQARRQLSDILQRLAPIAAQQIPIVGLEPSCVASFRDELPQLFPGDERAHAIANGTLLLSEFLMRSGYQPPRIDRRVLVHLHCHHHASLDASAERELLARAGVDAEILDAGCCGMAGSFGFRAESYDVSLKVGEHQLLPAVRAAAPDTLVLTNGFSCREQISQCTGREAMNLAQLLASALPRTGRRDRPTPSTPNRSA